MDDSLQGVGGQARPPAGLLLRWLWGGDFRAGVAGMEVGRIIWNRVHEIC